MSFEIRIRTIIINTGWTATFKKVKASNQNWDMPFPIVILNLLYNFQWDIIVFNIPGVYMVVLLLKGIFSLMYIFNWLLLVHIFKKVLLLVYMYSYVILGYCVHICIHTNVHTHSLSTLVIWSDSFTSGVSGNSLARCLCAMLSRTNYDNSAFILPLFTPLTRSLTS